MVSYCGRGFMGISLHLTLPRDGGVLHWAVKDVWSVWQPSAGAVGDSAGNKVSYLAT